MLPFQRHRQRFYDNMPSRGGAMSGGCRECGGICGGAQSPRQLMEQVLQHVEDGHISGGEIAEIIHEYTAKGMHGSGFFSSLWHGIKKVAGVVAPIVSMVPGFGSVAGNVLGAVAGSGKRKRRCVTGRKIEFCNIENEGTYDKPKFKRVCKEIKQICNKPRKRRTTRRI